MGRTKEYAMQIEALEQVKNHYDNEAEILKLQSQLYALECEQHMMELKGRKFSFDLFFKMDQVKNKIRALK